MSSLAGPSHTKKNLKKNKDSALMEEDEKNAFKKGRKKSYS